jgi:adenine-specific DNA-methyltransferase
LGAEKDSYILDFFSGSATTAHSIMQLNSEDNGSRKFIMVQLPELTDEKSEAYKAGYKNICEIGKDRIRRAGEKIKGQKGLLAEGIDIGFKALKLDNSNIRKWQPDYDNLEISLDEHINKKFYDQFYN